MTGLGVSAWWLLRAEETKLAETQFKSFAERAIIEATSFFQKRIMATVSIAAYVSEMLPDADPWPYVTVRGFNRLGTNLVKTSSGVAMGFAPIIRADEVEKFETFAYDYLGNTIPPFPEGTGMSSFGRGIFGIDPSRGAPDGRYRVINGTESYGSPHNILAPLLHLSEQSTNSRFIMYDPHSEPLRGRAIDKMIDCSLRLEKNEEAGNQTCTVLTETLELVNAPERGPAAIIMQPIYPSNDPTTLTGLVPNQIVWDELLENLFATEVSGIDCIIETKDQAFTYTINDGIAKYRSDSDLHEPKYDHLERCVTLTDKNLYSEGSPEYKLCLYPNKKLYKSYVTNNPRLATIGTVSIIVFTSLLFFVYDFFVRRDVTAKKELLQAKRRFMRFVSHEVRTPLSAVSMGLNLIQSEIASSLGFESRDDLDDFGHESASLQSDEMAVSRKDALDWHGMTREVQSNTQSAVNVLNDFLNYDKIETGTLHLELTVLPMWRVIEQAAKEFKLAAERKHIKLELGFKDHRSEAELTPRKRRSLSLCNTLPNNIKNNMVIGDSMRLIQVLRNLISNAIKFTPEQGNVSIRIYYTNPTKGEEDEIKDSFVLRNNEEVSYTRSGSVEVSVRDSGPGMTEGQLGKLFRPGVQFNVNELQAGKGSGLGLYIAKGIVEQHNGTLIATSEGLGRGSTFTLALPTHHIAERSSLHLNGNTNPNHKIKDSPAVESESLRILVVDDAASIRKLLSRLLEKRGRLCDQAEDGKVAVEKVKDSIENGDTYDAVLLDYEMPEMTGPEAAKRIRAMGSDVFIVGITGNLLPEDVAFFRSCGANAVLPKPLRIDDLEILLVEYGIKHNGASPTIDSLPPPVHAPEFSFS
eukprot:CAMPEP_0118677972 /NCGR_PEP_ID=MMETSP0800-20121206/2939_1 /TAXON_ID=210618 ORGANISM="Striatella unipunctata, Strain CCMP2910" /NCGR_SAMPLE_ID=MMETSP0800 /ASSEMBLY_ACC=CAM_ASM_000638 /LENGTH=863 /DNA_ID=CAMNT_0006573735 /DNA_START=141 /DNA_END=2732 /DNA_ORIENTATION=-